MHPIRLIVLCVALLLAVPGHTQTAVRTLRIGGFIVAPVMTGEAHQPIRGALPAFIMKEIAPHTDIRFEWLPPMAFKRATVGLREGSIDILLLVSGPQDAMPGVGRFDWSYLETLPQLAVRPDSPIHRIGALAQLSGVSLGWMGGSDLPDEMRAIPIKWQLVSAASWQSLNLRKMAARRVDAVFFGNQYSPAYFADKEKIAIRLVPLPMPPQRFELAYSLKADKALIRDFEKVAVRAFKGDRFKHYLEAYRD